MSHDMETTWRERTESALLPITVVFLPFMYKVLFEFDHPILLIANQSPAISLHELGGGERAQVPLVIKPT